MRKFAGVVALLLAAQVQAEEAKVQVIQDRPAVRGSIIANLLQNHDNPLILAELGWSFPITKHVRFYTKVFSGYSESMIDYNHRQTRYGVGVMLNDIF